MKNRELLCLWEHHCSGDLRQTQPDKNWICFFLSVIAGLWRQIWANIGAKCSISASKQVIDHRGSFHSTWGLWVNNISGQNILEEKCKEEWRAYSQHSSINVYYCLSIYKVGITDVFLTCSLPSRHLLLLRKLAAAGKTSSGSGPQRQHVAAVWRESHNEEQKKKRRKEKKRKKGMEKKIMHRPDWKDIFNSYIQIRKRNIPHNRFPFIPLSLCHPSWLLWALALEPQLPDKKEV